MPALWGYRAIPPACRYVNKDGTLAAGYNYALSLEQLCAPLDAMGVARRADAQ